MAVRHSIVGVDDLGKAERWGFDDYGRIERHRLRCKKGRGCVVAANTCVAGSEPAQRTSGFAAAWIGRVGHEVSILISAGGGGRYLGWQPRAKVSMMIMRLPQRGHGCSGAFGSSAPALRI